MSENWKDCCEGSLDRVEETWTEPMVIPIFTCEGCNITWELVWDGQNEVYTEAG